MNLTTIKNIPCAAADDVQVLPHDLITIAGRVESGGWLHAITYDKTGKEIQSGWFKYEPRMTYPTCRTCKHWRQWMKDRGRCDSPFSGRETPSNEEPHPPNSLCYSEGYEGESISTGPDFGCLHHEPKDAQ